VKQPVVMAEEVVVAATSGTSERVALRRLLKRNESRNGNFTAMMQAGTPDEKRNRSTSLPQRCTSVGLLDLLDEEELQSLEHLGKTQTPEPGTSSRRHRKQVRKLLRGSRRRKTVRNSDMIPPLAGEVALPSPQPDRAYSSRSAGSQSSSHTSQVPRRASECTAVPDVTDFLTLLDDKDVVVGSPSQGIEPVVSSTSNDGGDVGQNDVPSVPTEEEGGAFYGEPVSEVQQRTSSRCKYRTRKHGPSHKHDTVSSKGSRRSSSVVDRERTSVLIEQAQKLFAQLNVARGNEHPESNQLSSLLRNMQGQLARITANSLAISRENSLSRVDTVEQSPVERGLTVGFTHYVPEHLLVPSVMPRTPPATSDLTSALVTRSQHAPVGKPVGIYAFLDEGKASLAQVVPPSPSNQSPPHVGKMCDSPLPILVGQPVGLFAFLDDEEKPSDGAHTTVGTPIGFLGL
jgi:hypothetical protein